MLSPTCYRQEKKRHLRIFWKIILPSHQIINNKPSMKQIYVLILGFIIFVTYACNNDLKTIGQDMIDNGNYIGEEVLNVTEIATIRLDSFTTSRGLYSDKTINKLIIGRLNNEYGSTTTATPCFQVAPQYSPNISQTAVLDSLTLEFSYAGNMWGDTLYDVKPQRFYLYQIKELPEINYDDYGYFYNTTKVDLDSIIGTSDFIPKVENMRWAYFKINDNLAQNLFAKMQFREDNDIYEINSSSIPFLNFLLYFKGLAIVPDANNDILMSINALSDSLYLKFHYHSGSTATSFKFPISQREYQYNNFTTDRSGYFKDLENQQQSVPFNEAGDMAISQGLSGYMVKMDMPRPTLLPQYSTIVKAQLEIKPEYFKNNDIAYPKQIVVYTSDDLNTVISPLQNGPSSNVIGTLIVNDQSTDNTRYIFDITEYYQSLASAPPSAEKQQLLLSVPDVSLSYDYMIVREKPVVRVYYANYKQ